MINAPVHPLQTAEEGGPPAPPAAEAEAEAVEFTWYLSLKDARFQEAYDNYRLDDSDIFSKWAIGLSIFLSVVISLAAISVSGTFLGTVHAVGAIRPICIFLYIYITVKKAQNPSFQFRLPARLLGDILIITTTVYCTGVLVALARNGQCDDDNAVSLECNPVHDRHQLPMVPVARIFVNFIINSTTIRCHTAWVNLGSIVVSCAAVFIAMSYADSPGVLYPVMGTFFIASLISLHDSEYSSAHAFVATVRAEQATRHKAITENEKRIIEENAKDLRHFIGNVAHDLKTPLQGFVSELDVLEGSGDVATKAGRGSLRALKSTCHYMTMTINRSLDFVKSTSGFKLQPKAETVDIVDCFEWVRGCIKQYARQGMHIVLDPIASSMCRNVITDKQWLLENLLCLASNAVKYISNNGTVRFRVSIETAENCLSPGGVVAGAPRALLFEVEDDGVGITEEKMQTLFQPFRQAQRNAGGTGLGLFALANRTKAIGGTCGVCRRRDGGSGVLFWFTLPYRPDESVAALDLSVQVFTGAVNNSLSCDWSTTPSQDCSTPANKMSIRLPNSSEVHILLVEDSVIIQKATTRLLRNIGHSADIANHGMECLQRIREKRYDLILMDINMPVMDGLETIQRIRADEASASIDSQLEGGAGRRQIVVGISADSDTETRDAALRAGMNDYVEKPLDISTLKKKCLALGIVL